MKKQIRKIVSLILAATVIFSLAAVGISASAASTEGVNYVATTDGITGITYKIENGEVHIDQVAVAEDNIVIPETIDGYPVTEVRAVRDQGSKSVYLPKTVKETWLPAEKYIVDEENPYLSTDEHGVLFDKNKETLISYPVYNQAKEYKLPDTVKKIAEYAFEMTFYLENVILNEGLETIDNRAFIDSFVKTVNIPSTVTNVEEGAFMDCHGLEFITVDENNPNYMNDEYGVLFSKDQTKLYTFPASNPAESYVIPDSVEHIVFEWYGPTRRAFDELYNLKEITLPATSLDNMYGVPYTLAKLEKVNVSPDNPDYMSIDGVVYSKDGAQMLNYPGASKTTCFRIPDAVESIDYNCFAKSFGKEISYLASLVYNEKISENVTPVEDGSEYDDYDEHEYLTDIYYMGDGEYFERTVTNTAYDKEVTYHYNCKPDTHIHDYEFSVITESNCAGRGKGKLTCSCGKTIDVKTEPTNHFDFVPLENIEAKEYLGLSCRCDQIRVSLAVCAECDETAITITGIDYVPDYNNSTTITPATEEAEGKYVQICNDCGEIIDDGYIGVGKKTITFRNNGYDLVKSYIPGDPVAVKYYPKKENAEFIGWADENGNIVEIPEIMPDKDVKYTAIYRNIQKADGFDVTATYDDDCFNMDVEFSVKEIDGESKLGDIYMEDGKYFYQIGFYNIKMIDENGKTAQPNSGKTVTVKMHIPDEYKGKSEFVITHWFAEGGREKLSVSNKLAWVEDGYLCFTVSKFSEFAIHVPVTGSVEMASAPSKTSYNYKEELDLSGIKFVVAGEEGTLEEITDTSEMKVSGYDPNTVGEQTVTVECRGVTEEFKVTVSYAWWQWIIRILLLGFLWY